MKRSGDVSLETLQNSGVMPTGDNAIGTAGSSNENDDCMQIASNSSKRRHKLIKSCGFCRRRKLRCDQKKPMCSTCTSRNLTTCQYAEEYNKSVEEKASYGLYSNFDLLKKIDALENKIRMLENEKNSGSPTSPVGPSSGFSFSDTTTCSGSTGTPSSLANGVINPYADCCYLQLKHSGRSTVFGPTSMRTQIRTNNWGFIEKYKQLWAKVKVERIKWKQNNQKTMCRELSLLEDSGWGSEPLIIQICKCLPSYEKMSSIIDDFFSGEASNEMNIILDKRKVRRDFLDHFVPGKDVLPNGEKPICNILSNLKNNYYKGAVILMILCLKYYFESIPPPIEKFLVFLNGASTGKVFYIERAQMLILQIYHRETYLFGGDGSRLLGLNESLFSTVTNLGLHLNIRELFKTQESYMGSMESLENIWFMAVAIDYNISCHIGRPLLIDKFYLDEKQDYCILNDESDTYDGKFKRYLKMARSMLFALYDREKFPDLKKFSEQIINFIEVELEPLGHYTNENDNAKTPLREVRILSMALGLLLSFYALLHSVLKLRSLGAKSNTFHLVLINFSVIVNTTIRCFRIDKALYPEKFDPSYPHLPPHMALSMSLTAGLFSKTLVFFCSLIYFKMTLFENGICLSNDMECGWFDLTRLTVPADKDLTLGTAMSLYTKIFDRLFTTGNKELMRTMHRSPQFVIESAIERTYRTILGNVIEFRRMAEERWLTQIKQELDLQNEELPSEIRTEGEEQRHEPNPPVPPNVGFPASASAPSMIPNSAAPTPTDSKNIKSQSEIIQMLTDEFWTNYNLGWQELVDQSEFSTLFDDYENTNTEARRL